MKKDKSAPAVKAVKKKKAAAKKVANKKPTATSKTGKAPAAKKAAGARAKTVKSSQVSARERYEMIATMAYYRAEQRSFAPGHDQQDWYECERIVDEMLGRIK